MIVALGTLHSRGRMITVTQRGTILFLFKDPPYECSKTHNLCLSTEALTTNWRGQVEKASPAASKTGKSN